MDPSISVFHSLSVLLPEEALPDTSPRSGASTLSRSDTSTPRTWSRAASAEPQQQCMLVTIPERDVHDVR